MALCRLELLLGLKNEVLHDPSSVRLCAEGLVGDDAHVSCGFERPRKALESTIKERELLLVELKSDALVANLDGPGHGVDSDGCERTLRSGESMPFTLNQKV
jgi:hypothetical protein